MGARLCCAALMLALAPAAAHAQDGLRSASLPERPLSPSLVTQDGFRAGPGTYRPPPPRPAHPIYGSGYPWPIYGYPGYPGPVYGYGYGYPYTDPVIVVNIPPDAIRPAAPAPPPAPVAPPTPYIAGTPGRPKTFYVIPGCYAGDRRPEPESLPPGCRISRLRVVPPS